MELHDHQSSRRRPPATSSLNSVSHAAPASASVHHPAAHHQQQQQYPLGPAPVANPQHHGQGHGLLDHLDHSAGYQRTSTPVGHSRQQISPFDYDQHHQQHRSTVPPSGAGVDRESSLSYIEHQRLDQIGQMHGQVHDQERRSQNQHQHRQSTFEPLPQVPGRSLYEQQFHGQSGGQSNSRFQQQQQSQQQEYQNRPQHYQEPITHVRTNNCDRQGPIQSQPSLYHQKHPHLNSQHYDNQSANVHMKPTREQQVSSVSSSRSSSREPMPSLPVLAPELRQHHQRSLQSNSRSDGHGHNSPSSQQHRHHSQSHGNFSPSTMGMTQPSQLNVPQKQQRHHQPQHQPDYQQQRHHNQTNHKSTPSISSGIQADMVLGNQQQLEKQPHPQYQQHHNKNPDMYGQLGLRNSMASQVNFEAPLKGEGTDTPNIQVHPQLHQNIAISLAKAAESSPSSNATHSMPSIATNMSGATATSVTTPIGENKGPNAPKPFVTSARGKGNGAIGGKGRVGTGKRKQAPPAHQQEQSPQQQLELQKRQQEFLRMQMALPQNASRIQEEQNKVHDQTESWWSTFQSDIEKGSKTASANGSPESRKQYYQEASHILSNYKKVSQGGKMRLQRDAKRPDPMQMFGLIKREIHLIKLACNAVSGVLRKFFFATEVEGRVFLKEEKNISIKMAQWAQEIEIKLQAVIYRSRSILQGSPGINGMPRKVLNSASTIQTSSKNSGDGMNKGSKGGNGKKKAASHKKRKRPDKESTAEEAKHDCKDERKASNAKRRKAGGSNRKSKDAKPKKSEEGGIEKVVTDQQGPPSPNIANLKRNPNGPIITIKDQLPDRITNPLLELPHGSMSGDPNMAVSEYLKYLEVYFPEPDTYPLSYYAKLLGIPLPSNLPIAYNQVDSEKVSKDDEWLKIPALGKFGSLQQIRNATLERFDLNDSRREREFDFVDPIWRSILKDYRGYREDVFRPATEFHKPCEISKACLEFARDVNVVDSRMDFRVATLDDVSMLNEFQNDESLYSNFERLSQIMKCGNHFFLLATDTEKGLIGFIHYQFCWFKPKSLCVLSGEDVALERVVHVESIKCRNSEKSNGKTSIDSEIVGVYLVLFGIALEHCRSHVGYGMMDLPSSLSPSLKTFFRMSEVITKPEDSKDNRVLMACDLEKCSYRYSFLVGQRVLMKKYSRKGKHKKYRMVVQLPTTCRKETNSSSRIGNPVNRVIVEPSSQTSASNNTSKPGNTLSTARDETHISKDKKPQDTLGRLFSGIETSRKHKKVMVHIEKGKINVRRRYNKIVSPQSKGLRSLSKCDDWIPISCFTSRTDGNAASSASNSIKTDTVLAELEKQQQKLIELEKSNSSVLQSLLRQVFDERMHFETGNLMKSRIAADKTVIEYEAAVQRRRDAQKALELQQEEEENAVCDICGDGESTGENRIIFCDACDISVHQNCYGIEKVPRGDYFCRPCLYYKRDKQSDKKVQNPAAIKASGILNTKCELCPRRQGAFVQCENVPIDGRKTDTKAEWVHLLCAKWQGLNFVDYYVDGVPDLMVEDVQPLKEHFRIKETRCFLCEGARGSYNQCSHEGCDRMLHVTCARASGICEINHGVDHTGPVDSDKKWTLFCPEHSTFDPDYTPPSNKMSIKDLIANAKTFPPEVKPMPPPTKPFNKMTGKERIEYLKDPEYERQFNKKMVKATTGLRCAVCDLSNSSTPPAKFLSCSICGCTAHENCIVSPWRMKPLRDKRFHVTCTSCLYIEEHQNDENYEVPQCHMCNFKEGTLIHSFAKPVTMKKWKSNQSAFKKSLFGKKIWCHPTCAIWNNKVHIDDDGVADCSNIVMANGIKHIQGKHFCVLCGRQDKSKIHCNHPQKKGCRAIMHATCARQAGLEVSTPEAGIYNIRCFRHSECSFTFRAFLEDMIEFEKLRAGNNLTATGRHMTNECVSNIFNSGIRVLNCLGWAWKWASWWVSYGDNWEPFLEPGEVEENMTDEELRKVESTPISRRTDARKCRLAAFGAALRNRSYDDNEGDNMTPLRNALRAIMSTPSLVGPLTSAEIDFFVDWLGRIYRSESPLLGFGDSKIPVAEKWTKDSPVYFANKTAKFELGTRPLPGKQELREGQLFEEGITEIDDYFEGEEAPPDLYPSPAEPTPEILSQAAATPTTMLSKNSESSDRTSSKGRNLSSSKRTNSERIEVETARTNKSISIDGAEIEEDKSILTVEGQADGCVNEDIVSERSKSKSIPDVSIPKKRDRQPTLNDPIPKKRKPSLNDPIPKKRGRPPSNSTPKQRPDVVVPAVTESRGPGRPPKKRGPGRPPKDSTVERKAPAEYPQRDYAISHDQHGYSRPYNPKRGRPNRKR